MPLVSRDRFAAACRDADPETFGDFVAALFEARGHTIERRDDGLFRTQPDDRLIAVGSGDGDLPSAVDDNVDVIVTLDTDAARAEGMHVLGVDDLHRQVCYAVDRDDARGLLSDHFDIDLSTGRDRADAGGTGPEPSGEADASTREAPHGSPGDRDRNRNRRPGGLRVPADPWRRRVAVAFGVVFLVAVGISAAVSLGGFPLAGPNSSGPGTATATPAESVVLTPARVGGPSSDDTLSDIEASELNVGRPVEDQPPASGYPPGVTAAGLVDHERLVDAHTAALSNTSYTIRLSYREFVGGQLTGVHTETVRVGAGSRYRVSVSRLGEFRSPPREIAGTDVFSNGTHTFVRSPDAGGFSRPTTDANQYLDTVARYLRWSLSVRESSVRELEHADNGTAYLLLMRGEDYPGLEDASGNAYVTGEGLVRHGRWSYREAYRENVSIEFTVQTTNVGETTVTRPAWVDEE